MAVPQPDKFQFAIDRGGTFTDVFARCPRGKVRVMKLLSEDPANYRDAPTEGIRRILEEVSPARLEERSERAVPSPGATCGAASPGAPRLALEQPVARMLP